ncbi:hypothetical protein ACSBR2_016520 [Camellia fascicularis]
MQKKLGGGDAPVSGKLSPVTIRWSNITCSLSDKSSKAVSVSLFYNTSSTFCTRQLGFCKKCLVAEKMYEKVSCADSRVGDAKVRGISGGKKKHLSMACELLTSPSVIFADEPTTGLGAFQAEKMMETLHQLAQDGLTKVHLFMPVPHVMNHCYRYRCPELVNPAEFLADLMSIDNSSAESVYSSQKRIHGLVESFSQQTSSILYATPLVRRETSRNSMNLRKKTIVKKKGGWWRQFWLLLKRAWMQASRDGPTNKVRARMSIIFGSVFWRMGRSQSSIQDRMGLLWVCTVVVSVKVPIIMKEMRRIIVHLDIYRCQLQFFCYYSCCQLLV